MKKCECGGEIEQGKGCLAYLGSEKHDRDANYETIMRTGGYGFTTHNDTHVAMMSVHLQENGFSLEEAEEILSL